MSKVTEQELIEKSKAPRVTAENLEGNIKEQYFINPYKVFTMMPDVPNPSESLKVLTLCVLVLQNGFTVVGQSACAYPENYDKEIGERLALADAKGKMWALMGYALKQDLYLKGADTVKGRLEVEAKETKDRLAKLTDFLSTNAYQDLPFQQRELLVDQQVAMMEYENILNKRLAIM